MAEMLLHYTKKRAERSDNHMTLNMTLDEEISLGGPHNRVRNRKVSSSLSAKSSNFNRYNTVVKRNVGRREAYFYITSKLYEVVVSVSYSHQIVYATL